MTGSELAPLVAVLGAVALINLAFAWLFARSDRDPSDFFGSGRGPSEDAAVDSGRDDDLDPDRDRGSAPDPPTSRDGTTGFVTTAGEPGQSGDPPSLDPPPLDADGETVVCRHCGAENRTGYRYCRWCVRSGFVDAAPGDTSEAAMTNRSL